MNLNELVLRLRKPPEKSAHEIVRAPDGMNHLVAIIYVCDILENGVTVRKFAFATWCSLSVEATDLEVVRDESITCIRCIQWRAT